MATYSIGLWGSHPSDGNDDCGIGTEPMSEAEARALFLDPTGAGGFEAADLNAYAYVSLTRETPTWGVVEVRPLHDAATLARMAARAQREAEADERAWRREIANEAGMLHGCEAYNEVMGWEVTDWD